MVSQEDAHHHIVRCLRGEAAGTGYGYDLYLRNAIGSFVGAAGTAVDPRVKPASPPFMAAAWELCRRGILRPGVQRLGDQSTDDGHAGAGFSLTPLGRAWLEEGGPETYVPTEPGRFAEMIGRFRGRFGPAFLERAQEAIRCYGAHAYLACCAMCGAAAEAIIIAAATQKTRNEERVLRDMASSGGRSRIERLLIGEADRRLQVGFQASHDLLKYWRDISAHGRVADIAEEEAYTALFLLLRFAQHVADNWDELTG